MGVNYNDLGVRIRSFRQRAGLRQHQLGEMIEQEGSYISRIETAASKISLPTLVSIANALNVTMDDLLCGSLTEADVSYNKELDYLLSDCTHEERQFLVGAVQDLKKRMRESGLNRSNDIE